MECVGCVYVWSVGCVCMCGVCGVCVCMCGVCGESAYHTERAASPSLFLRLEELETWDLDKGQQQSVSVASLSNSSPYLCSTAVGT